MISAQLRALDQEHPGRTDWSLLIRPSTRAPAPGHASIPIDDGLLIRALQHGNTWLVALALALAKAGPTPGTRLVTRIVTELTSLTPRTHMRKAEFLAFHWPDLSLPDNAIVRAGATRANAAALANGLRHHDARPLLSDPDLLVREQTARGLGAIPASELPGLVRALAVPTQQWTCLDCKKRSLLIQRNADMAIPGLASPGAHGSA
ncbi:hypothetical protein [Streptomyces sp. WAC 04229]|uniref:hypothetical protein n=1 Tax=Streptomyces sp. WAC 04229 TaxID=2203206 RepID=UPI003D7231D3